MGCYNCCMRCLGGIPYTSLVATLMCFSGVALFCGCGHQALTETERLIEYYFARNLQDYVTLAYIIQYFQYIIYALASFFFLYCILLLAEGFYTTSAAKQAFGEFRSTVCGRCLGITFIAVTYALAVLWLAMYAFSALPVFFFYNMAATCHTIDELSDSTSNINQLCIDARQYGLLPWNVTPGKVCGMTLLNTCKTKEFQLTYDLFIAAFAGAGITLLALLTYVMSTTYNFAVLRYLGRKGIGYLVIWNARIQADGNEWSVGCEIAMQCVTTLLYGFLHLATTRLYLRERRRKHKAEFVDLFGTPVMDWKRGLSSPYGAPDQEL